MFPSMQLPWPKIHDFLLEAGSQRTFPDFTATVMAGMSGLLPYEYAAWFEMGPTKPISCCKAMGLSSDWIAAHNDYYYRLTPPVCNPVATKVGFMDWYQLRDTEYARDLMLPLGIRYGAGIILHDRLGNPAYSFSITDSKFNYQQHERIRLLFEALHLHLTNYYTYISLLSAKEQHHIHLAELAAGCKLLTKREAEIAGLLCRRFNVPEISSLLLISPKTVYRHVANIYEKLGVNSRKELIVKLLGSEVSGGLSISSGCSVDNLSMPKS